MSGTPNCRECGKSEWVAVWWPDKPEEAICVECCKHADGYEYDRDQRHHACPICSAQAPASFYDNWNYPE